MEHPTREQISPSDRPRKRPCRKYDDNGRPTLVFRMNPYLVFFDGKEPAPKPAPFSTNELEHIFARDDGPVGTPGPVPRCAADTDVGEASASSEATRPPPPPPRPARKTLPPLPPELSYDRARLLPVDDGRRSALLTAADLSSPLPNGWTVLPHQKTGIARALIMRRLVLAYDMGLGKTLVACVYAKAFRAVYDSLKVIIIAPVSTHKDWVRTAAATVNLEFVIRGKESADLVVESWGKIPAVPGEGDYIVICDEAHSMQNIAAGRTKNTLALTGGKRCVGCLLLTGTPMKNGTPSNIFPLLKAVRHPLGENQKQFEIFFCMGREANYGRGKIWEANGAANLPALHAHISTHVLHKMKEGVLKDLPPKTRQSHTVAVAPIFKTKYSYALNELAKAHHESQANRSISKEAVLGAFQNLRVVTSSSKILATVALAQSILQEEPAIVIFTSFVNVAKSIQQKLSDCGWDGEILTGETPQKKRQGIVDRFQSGQSAVFVATFGAGGVGLTLTAAHTIVLVDRPWTPGDAFQAEDRIWRIGQTKPVKCIWMQSFEVDRLIDDIISQKNDKASAVIGGKAGSNSNEEKASIYSLIRDLVPTNTT